MLRWLLELAAGVAAAFALTFAVMGLMFTFGHWANPPGMDELFYVLVVAAVALASWRAYRRAHPPGDD